ncbi:MAG: glycosyltransferase family A protein [Candidatus Bathyarchaeia archaeon]
MASSVNSNIVVPKIDVVMPTWNSNSPYFPLIIRRIYELVKLNRLILVDRFSTDGTIEVVKSIVEPRKLRIVQTNSELANARRLGIKYVTTPIFMFIDSDVILPRGWEKLYVFLLRHKSIGAVSLPLCAHWSTSEKGAKVRLPKPYKALSKGEIIRKGLFQLAKGDLFLALIRTELVKDWEPPENLSALEVFSLTQHILGKGYLWVELPKPCCYHTKELKIGCGFVRYLKQGLWEGAGARYTGIKVSDFLLEVSSRLCGGIASLVKTGQPLYFVDNCAMRFGQIIGFLIPHKYRTWKR